MPLLQTPVRSVHALERCQRGMDMNIASGGGAGWTVEEPGALCAVTEEHRDLEPRPRAV